MGQSTPINANLTPISEKGVKTLQTHADAISAEVTDRYFEKHPECYKGGADKIRQMCKADFHHHLRFLLSAMVTATTEIFYDYATWLKDVLERRNLSLEHPIDSFTFMQTAIVARLDIQDQPVANAVMEAGLRALNEKDSQLHDFDARFNHNDTPNYTQALIQGNRAGAESIVTKGVDEGIGLIELEVGIIQPAMYEIGRLWQQNKITVAQEHLATAISQNTLARAFLSADFADPNDKKVVCACVEGNQHGLGLRMVSDAFELAGWDSTFLGADTPNNSLIQQVDLEKPDAIAVSISMPHQILALSQLIGTLKSEFSGHCPAIVVGGLALNHHGDLAKRLVVDNWYQDAKGLADDLS